MQSLERAVSPCAAGAIPAPGDEASRKPGLRPLRRFDPPEEDRQPAPLPPLMEAVATLKPELRRGRYARCERLPGIRAFQQER